MNRREERLDRRTGTSYILHACIYVAHIRHPIRCLASPRGNDMNGTRQGCPLFREEGREKEKLSWQLISYFIGGNESR